MKYGIMVTCLNCGIGQYIEIPVGELIAVQTCPVCGCKALKKDTFSKAYPIKEAFVLSVHKAAWNQAKQEIAKEIIKWLPKQTGKSIGEICITLKQKYLPEEEK